MCLWALLFYSYNYQCLRPEYHKPLRYALQVSLHAWRTYKQYWCWCGGHHALTILYHQARSLSVSSWPLLLYWSMKQVAVRMRLSKAKPRWLALYTTQALNLLLGPWWLLPGCPCKWQLIHHARQMWYNEGASFYKCKYILVWLKSLLICCMCTTYLGMDKSLEISKLFHSK